MKKIGMFLVLSAFVHTSAQAFWFSKKDKKDKADPGQFLCAEINPNDLGIYLIDHSKATYPEIEPMLETEVCVERAGGYLIDDYHQLEKNIQKQIHLFASKNGPSKGTPKRSHR